MDSSLFRVLLLLRLWLPLLPSRASAGVAVHLTPVATTVQRTRRQECWVVEATLWKAAWVCWEAGARVSTIVLVRDLDLLPLQHVDARRLEVVADGLRLFHGAQIAVDTTLVSPRQREIRTDLEVEHDSGLRQRSCFRAPGRSYHPRM